MNKLMTIVAGAVVVLGTAVALGGTAKAEVNGPSCDVFTRQYYSDKDSVTAIFEVRKTGDKDCTKDVSLVSWNAPSIDGTPIEEQTFVDSASDTYAPGHYKLTVKKPKCFYQVDLIRGLNVMGEGPLGGADYTADQFVSATHGGQACEEPKPEPKPQPKPQPKGTGGPKALPNTGAGEVVAIAAGVGAATGVAYNIRARRNRR